MRGHDRLMRHVLPLAFALLALAGCATPPSAPAVRPVPIVAPTPRPAPTPQPLASDWNDWPFTSGEWRYMPTATGSVASFGAGPGGTVLGLQCMVATRSIVLSVDWQSAGPATARTTTMTRALTLAAGNNSVPAVRIAANDPLLDAMAFSRGRFVIEQAGQAPLVLPPHAEIGRVIEDCRR